MKKALILITFVICGALALAHSGRTDSKGGHYNRRTGEYHYHDDGVSLGQWAFLAVLGGIGLYSAYKALNKKK